MAIYSPDRSSGIAMRFLLHYRDPAVNVFSLDVDITVPGSGITAIFGQSGSGKTTLLRCVAGLERSHQGRLTVNTEIWQNEDTFIATHRRPLGYVFQQSSLFPHLSAQGNLNYAIKRAAVTVTAELYERVMAVMDIEAVLQQYPNQLSGGECQRVAIARALLIQPRLLLMDEPLASLDTARKQEILPYLERLRSSFDMPILYVSHCMDEVARLADHAVILKRGRVVAQGDLDEVFSRVDQPAMLGEEAGVILIGRAVERDSRWHLTRIAFAGGELWVRDGGEALEQTVRIRVLARDVSLALSSHQDSSILNRLPVQVEAICQDQDESMSLVRLKSGSQHLIAKITQKSVHQLALEPGMRAWAQIKSVAIVR